ncbi:MAG: hypothetical protein MHM6MM_002320 [Cercozoa sp. M6MM]
MLRKEEVDSESSRQTDNDSRHLWVSLLLPMTLLYFCVSVAKSTTSTLQVELPSLVFWPQHKRSEREHLDFEYALTFAFDIPSLFALLFAYAMNKFFARHTAALTFVVLVGIVGALTSAAAAAMSSFVLFVVARFIQGIAHCSFKVLSKAVFVSRLPHAKLAFALGMIHVGCVFATVVDSALSERLFFALLATGMSAPFSASVFLIAGGAMTALFLPFLWWSKWPRESSTTLSDLLVTPSRDSPERRPSYRLMYDYCLALCRAPITFWLLFTIGVLVDLSVWNLYTSAKKIFVAQFGFVPTLSFVAVYAASARYAPIFAPLIGHLSDRCKLRFGAKGLRWLLLLGTSLTLLLHISLIALAQTGVTQSTALAWTLAATFFAFGLTNSIVASVTQPSIAVMSLEHGPPESDSSAAFAALRTAKALAKCTPVVVNEICFAFGMAASESQLWAAREWVSVGCASLALLLTFSLFVKRALQPLTAIVEMADVSTNASLTD